LIDKEDTLLYFSKCINRSVKAYKEFVEADEGKDESPFMLMKKKEGLSPQKALFAVAHKLIRVIFAMLSQRTCFRTKEVI
jgi:hypothetical protein